MWHVLGYHSNGYKRAAESNAETRSQAQRAVMDKKLAKKLAKMSEEERAQFLEQQRLQEEEMQRKKEEMLSRFLKV